jgi:hypothetical protein
MATAVETASGEIAARLIVVEPQREGLRDYARLEMPSDALREVSLSIQQYDRRLSLMRAARDACEALMADGYPDLDVREIPDAAYEALRENAATIQAALAQFASGRATEMHLTGGTPEPKGPRTP